MCLSAATACNVSAGGTEDRHGDECEENAVKMKRRLKKQQKFE